MYYLLVIRFVVVCLLLILFDCYDVLIWLICSVDCFAFVAWFWLLRLGYDGYCLFWYVAWMFLVDCCSLFIVGFMLLLCLGVGVCLLDLVGGCDLLLFILCDFIIVLYNCGYVIIFAGLYLWFWFVWCKLWLLCYWFFSLRCCDLIDCLLCCFYCYRCLVVCICID